MRYIEFGQNATKVSEIVLGAMRIAPMAPAEVADLIEAALDAGVNAVDTAPIYGPSEGLPSWVRPSRSASPSPPPPATGR